MAYFPEAKGVLLLVIPAQPGGGGLVQCCIMQSTDVEFWLQTLVVMEGVEGMAQDSLCRFQDKL